jgi:hypothetical protein
MSFEEIAVQFAGLTSMIPHTQGQELDRALAQLSEAGATLVGQDTSANWQAEVNMIRAQVASVGDAMIALEAYIAETAGKIRAQQL